MRVCRGIWLLLCTITSSIRSSHEGVRISNLRSFRYGGWSDGWCTQEMLCSTCRCAVRAWQHQYDSIEHAGDKQTWCLARRRANLYEQDEMRGAMIHILSEGQVGMPSVEDGGGGYNSSSFGNSGGFGGAGGVSGDGDDMGGLPLVRLESGGLGIAAGGPTGETWSEKDLRQRAHRARVAAGVACLWAGIGVGAMLCGETAEATRHYAENAREAIKGCYDVVSEEVGMEFECEGQRV